MCICLESLVASEVGMVTSQNLKPAAEHGIYTKLTTASPGQDMPLTNRPVPLMT